MNQVPDWYHPFSIYYVGSRYLSQCEPNELRTELRSYSLVEGDMSLIEGINPRNLRLPIKNVAVPHQLEINMQKVSIEFVFHKFSGVKSSDVKKNPAMLRNSFLFLRRKQTVCFPFLVSTFMFFTSGKLPQHAKMKRKR